MWNVADGEHLTVLGNTVNNISIRPCAFFDDNVTVASAQMEGKVTVSVCVCVPGFMIYCMAEYVSGLGRSTFESI